MNANGQTFDDVGDVRVKYDSGPSTMLSNHPHLACRVALLGAPTRVVRLGSARLVAEWDLPGRMERHTFGNPWPMDRRAVTFLEVTGAAVDVVYAWIGEQRIAAAARIEAAERDLKALREAAEDVLDRGGKAAAPYYTDCGEEGCSICGAPR